MTMTSGGLLASHVRHKRYRYRLQGVNTAPVLVNRSANISVRERNREREFYRDALVGRPEEQLGYAVLDGHREAECGG